MERYIYLLEKSGFNFKQYQYDGVQWCVNNELRTDAPDNVRGGFIADEMGLGKTLMMIGTMYVNIVPRTLIVVPPVLIQQWFNEIYKISAHRALIYYGPERKLITQEQINNARIVLTTYNTLLIGNMPLNKLVWDRTIFDEAHHLRNKNKRYDACLALKSNVKWLVTGTPVQNTIKNFYNLCNALGLSQEFYKNPANLSVIGRNFILRRTKAQVGINIPLLNIENCSVDWKNKSEMLLSEELHSLIPTKTGVSVNRQRQFAKTFIGGKMVAMLKARQSCILPSLLRDTMTTLYNKGLIDASYYEALDYSSKIDAVIELLIHRKNNGRGKIVFCHFHSEIDIIYQRLVNNGFSKVVKYDGRNSGGSNLATIADSADVLIIQIQTGSEGLNLQEHYSEIYFVSPHWNPSVEDQAIARCHRIGQKNVVDVFKFQMSGFLKDKDAEVDPITLENYISIMQNGKRELSAMILNN